MEKNLKFMKTLILFLLFPMFCFGQTLYETRTFLSTNWKIETDTFSKLENHFIFYAPVQNYFSISYPNSTLDEFLITRRFQKDDGLDITCTRKDDDKIFIIHWTKPNEEGEEFIKVSDGVNTKVFAR